MKIFNKNQFIELSKKSDFPFISIYTQTTRLSTNAYKDDNGREYFGSTTLL
jgi:hypothetical protein